ncbi:MAG: CHASE3 domain-containing protein [Rhodoferax sp.]
MKTQHQTLGWIAASAMCIAALVASLFSAYRQIETAAAATGHTQRVISGANGVLSTLKDAETGQRGFLLTGDERFLEPYLDASGSLKAEIDSLSRLTRDTAANGHLQAITPLVDAKMAELKRLIDLRRSRGLIAAQAAVSAGAGRRIMDTIRTEMDGFIEQEQARHTTQEMAFRSTMQRLFAVIALASLLASLMGMGIAYLVYRQSRQRAKEQVYLETRHLLAIQQATNQELKTANETLQVSEERLAVTLNSIGDGVIATDAQGRVTLLNPLAESLTGWSHAEALGRPVDEVFLIVNQETRLPATIPVMEALSSGTIQGLANHTILIARGGTECDIADSCAPIRGHDKQVVGAVLVFRDVTAEYAVQRSLRAQEFYTRSLIESNIDAMVATDPSGCITDVNQQMVNLTGFSRVEMIGSPFKRYFSDPERAQAGILRVLVDKRVSDYELTTRPRVGPETVVSYNASVFLDRDGNIEGVFAAARDITERRRLDTLLIEKNTELERARSVADKANLAKSEFLATMSHEIRTPMNGVIGMLDVLEQSSLNGPQLEMTNVIHDSAFALLTVINDILDFSKIEANKLETELVPMSIGDTVESACTNMNQLATKKNVELTLFVDPAIPASVLGDPGRIRQVLINLTNNAIKFSSQLNRVGRVSVRAILSERLDRKCTVDFQVCDNGIGIDESTRARLFNAFIQADNSITRTFGGTGLGLAISGKLVELMGGTIAVQSVLTQGSNFTVRLPFTESDEAVPPVAEPGVLQGLHCLVLVGTNGMGEDIVSYLTHANAIVERAADMEAAQRWVQAHPDGLCVVIVDVADCQTTASALRRVFREQPGQERHFVVIGRGKRRRPRVETLDVVSVDGNLLTRNALLHTVAIAAGMDITPAIDTLQVPVKSAPAPTTRDEARREGRLILVAEDNEYNQKVILQQLMLLGRTADIANNGREALKRWESGDYGILLADLHMPEMDGYELTTAIRAAEIGDAHIPIIAFTANALKGEAEHCIAMGMDDYLSKPVQMVRLKAMLKKWQPVVASGMMPLDSPAADAPTITHPPATQAAASPWVIPVDVKVLEALVGSDITVLCEFLRDFRTSSARAAGDLRTAHASGLTATVQALAHKLKSSARAVGALRLGGLCAELEAAGQENNAAGLNLIEPQFEKEFARVDRFLLGYLSMRSDETTETGA